MIANVIRRLFAGTLARAFGSSGAALAATLVIQVASVPLYLNAVGLNVYAEWLVLTAIPAYLTVGDIGFAAATATSATYALRNAEPSRANAIVNSGSAFVGATSLILAVLAAAIGSAFVNDATFPLIGSDAKLIICLQLAWVAVWMQLGFVEAAFRADGQYPRGINYLTLTRVVEFGAAAAALLVTHRVLYGAATLLLARSACAVLIWHSARKRISWYRPSLFHATWAEVRSLLVPSVTYAGITIGMAVLNQGLIIIVGYRLDRVSLVTFTTVRTLANTIQQLTAAIVDGALAELTSALAARRYHAASQAFRSTTLIATVICLLASTLLILSGSRIVAVWTTSAVQPAVIFVAAMVITTAADVTWRIPLNLLRADNRHQSVGIAFLFAVAATLIVTWLTIPIFGLIGVPLALLVMDVILTPVALGASAPIRRSLRSARLVDPTGMRSSSTLARG